MKLTAGMRALLVVAGLISTGSLGAQEIDVSLSSSISYGEQVVLQVRLVNPGRALGQPRLPAVEGLEVVGPYGPSQQLSVVNNVQTRSIVYQYRVRPKDLGTFTIGPVTIPRGSAEPLQSRPVKLGVYRRPDPGLFFDCEVTPREGDVGDRFRVVYTLYFPREPRERRSIFDSVFDDDSGFLEKLEFPLLLQPGLRVRPAAVEPGSGSAMVKVSGTDVPFTESFVARGDTGYQAFVFAFDVEPLRTGKVDVGGAEAAKALLTGRVVTSRDVFGRQVNTRERKRFEAVVEPTYYTVHPVPVEGQPEGFTGAIGRYRISVTTKDRDVAAFDPVVLEVRVEGDGLLEELQPPAWSKVEALRRDFEVSPDVDYGKVEDTGKVFRQVVRPLSDAVTEVPSVPFPYYDPWLKKYAVARSDPIAIRVRAAQTKDSSDALVKNGSDSAASEETEPELVVEQFGVPANFVEYGPTAPPRSIGARLLAPSFLLTLAVPPCVLVAAAAFVALRRRNPEEKERQRALRRARGKLMAGGTDAEALSTSFQDYLRVRFRLPAGEVTPGQLAQMLQGLGAKEETITHARGQLEKLLASRFGGSGLSVGELHRGTCAVVDELDRLRR